MTRIRKFGLICLIAVAAMLPSHSSNAQQLTDAQAQVLIQALASQNAGGAALTAAQNQMLLQYLMSKQGSAAAMSSLSAAQTQVQTQAQTQMILRQLTSGRQVVPGGGASALLPQSAGLPTTTPAGTAVLGEKKPGVVRIGIIMPKSQLGQGAQGPAAGEPLRSMLAQYLAGPSVEVVSIVALLPQQIDAESQSKLCDYLVYSSISQKKATGGLSMLKNASGLANMIPIVGVMNGATGAMAAATAATTATQAAMMSSAIKAKSDVILEYHMTAMGNTSPALSNSLTAKATADGEDVITPLVEKEATAIMTEVSKKK
jgi:hypothetical protein